MKTLVSLIFLLIMSFFSYAEKLAEMPELEKYFKISVGEDKIYISDGNAYKVRIYSLKDYGYIKSFGRKGEGPGEFPNRPMDVYFRNKELIFLNRSLMRFTPDGGFINQKKIDLKYPKLVLNRFVSFKFIHPISLTAFGNPHILIYTCNASKSNQKEIYKIVEKSITMAMPKGFEALSGRQSFGVSEDKIIIADPEKGFFFKIFDYLGNPVKELNVSYKKTKVNKAVKVERLRVLKSEFGKSWKSFSKRFKFFWPDYVPAYERVKIYDDKIYAFTFTTKGDDVEMVVIDLNGKVLGKTFVPYDSMYMNCVKNSIYYYLHEGDDVWELHSRKTF